MKRGLRILALFIGGSMLLCAIAAGLSDGAPDFEGVIGYAAQF